jgi:hypothetical protein
VGGRGIAWLASQAVTAPVPSSKTRCPGGVRQYGVGPTVSNGYFRLGAVQAIDFPWARNTLASSAASSRSDAEDSSKLAV